jgi:predicted neuraminidase
MLAISVFFAAAPAPESELIYDKAPFPSCHASTICDSERGPVAAWFGGTREKHPDVGIWISRKIDGKWTAPAEMANGVQYTAADGKVKRHPCWNPVLFRPKSGPLMLFYKVGPDPAKWWGQLMPSHDAGATWSEPRRLPEGIDGPVKNKPLQLPDGSILCPSSTEDAGWRVHFERTADLGKTWTRIGPANDGKTIAAIQPSLLSLGGDKLAAIGRTRNGKLFRTQSDDLGKTWNAMDLLDVPNPNSGTDAVTLADGRHVLVYNPVPLGRTPLVVAISKDSLRWTPVLKLETEPGEYSYPAIIQANDGRIHITYTWKRERIKHVSFLPDTLKE